ncbi:MAG: hypothetical protein ACRC7N_17715 [Clostridium sp.]
MYKCSCNGVTIQGMVVNQYGSPEKDKTILIECWCPYCDNKMIQCNNCNNRKRFIFKILKTDKEGRFYVLIENTKLCYKIIPIDG